MLKKMMVVVVAALVVTAGTRVARADVSAELGVDYMSRYIWRGQLLENKPVLQPWVAVEIGNFTIETWANMNTKGSSGEFNEVDIAVDYSDSLTDMVGFSVGIIRYEFPNTEDDGTAEIYAGLSFETFLSPSVTLYYDIDEVEGSYLEFAVGHELELTDQIALDASASMGWGSKKYTDAYWDVNSSKMQDLTLSVAMPVALGDWTLTPSVGYVTLISSSLRDTKAYHSNNDLFFAGLGLSTSF